MELNLCVACNMLWRKCPAQMICWVVLREDETHISEKSELSFQMHALVECECNPAFRMVRDHGHAWGYRASCSSMKMQRSMAWACWVFLSQFLLRSQSCSSSVQLMIICTCCKGEACLQAYQPSFVLYRAKVCPLLEQVGKPNMSHNWLMVPCTWALHSFGLYENLTSSLWFSVSFSFENCPVMLRSVVFQASVPFSRVS